MIDIHCYYLDILKIKQMKNKCHAKTGKFGNIWKVCKSVSTLSVVRFVWNLEHKVNEPSS